jgi:NAD(P)-dependent dehydrogenase (short-subunit alcohol dehydrogenase family)
MKMLKNKVAAVTGAASGIGRMLAVSLAKEGCHLALSDVDDRGLRETVALIREGVRVTMHHVDVSDRAQVYTYAEDTVRQHGCADIIINNAGVAVCDTLEDVSYENFEWLFSINFWGVVYGTRAFLPHLKKRPEAHIVNISSINAMVPFSHNGPYNAAKSAVMGFTETLVQELDGSTVRVSCVHPGGIKTNIARNARFCKHVGPGKQHEEVATTFERIARTTADRAARVIIAGMKRNKRRIMIGLDARFMDMQKRLAPVLTNVLTGRIMRSMD